MEFKLILITFSTFLLLLVTTAHCFGADRCYINGKHKCLLEPDGLGMDMEEVFHGNKVCRNPAVNNSSSQFVSLLMSSFIAVDEVVDCPPPSFTVLPSSLPELTQHSNIVNSNPPSMLKFLPLSLPEVTQYYPSVITSNPHRHHRQKRIVGGTYADPADFPFMVNVRSGKDGAFCGGVIIASTSILTAAHCLLASTSSFRLFSPRDVKVYLGRISIDFSYSLEPDHRRGIRTAQEIIVHPEFYFNETIFQNDIAIIKITKPFKLKSSNFQPISLADENFSPTSGIALGWGTTESFPYSVNPRQVDLPIVKDCSWMHMNVGFDPKTQFCAGGIPQQDSCDGDSGGPFLSTTEVDGERRKVLYGIISYGAPICGHDAGVYTKVSAYRKWIFGHLENKPFPKLKNSASTVSKFPRYYFVFIILIVNLRF